MKVPKFIEEIDRLFDEMVRDPWTRTRPVPAQVRQPDATHLEVHIPLADGEPGDVAFAVEGQRLTVTLRRRQSKRISDEGGEIATDRSEHIQRTFTLPEDTNVRSIEARFEANMLRVRIELRGRRG